MMLRLDELLGRDRKSRWRIIFVSALGMAIWGIVSEFRGNSVQQAQVAATMIGGGLFLSQLLVYCSRLARPQVHFERVLMIPRRLVFATTGTAVAILLAAIPAPAVEAAILDRRLRTLTQGRTLSPEQAKEVASVLDIAATGSIKLPDRTCAQVYQAVKSAGLEYPDSLPILDCANRVVRYTRHVTFAPTLDAKAITGTTEAWMAYRLGARYAMSVLLGPLTVPTSYTEDAVKAVAEFSRAAELSLRRDRDVRVGALTMRATMYLELLQPTDALTDAKTLESIGGADLSNILAIEGTALFMRGGHDDLEKSVRSFTLVTKLDSPTWAASDPRLATILRIDALGNRGKAYYKLGNFENCIRDTNRALDLLIERERTLGLERKDVLYYLKLAYLSIVASDLQLGNVDQARRDAYAWLERSGNDPDALDFVAEVESSHFDRQLWLKRYVSH